MQPIALVRGPADVNPRDAEAVRAWLMGDIRQEVKLRGEPYPRILLVGDGFVETFDLVTMTRTDPGASAGATFQLLRERPNIERRFVLMQMSADDDAGNEHRFALLFEEIDDLLTGTRRWWCATLEFETDPQTGIGRPAPEWEQSAGETEDPAHLYPFMRELAAPPPGARPAAILPPRMVQPDIHVAFDDLPDGVPTPADAKQMVELTAQLAVQDLLTGAVKGTVVVRIAGRSWECWVLDGQLPTSLNDMIRYIANSREPAADGVGLAQIAIMPNDEPPVPGVQVIAEKDGMFVETWAPLEFPEGPSGPKRIPRIHWRDPRPVSERGMWLGVDPHVNFELGPFGAAEA